MSVSETIKLSIVIPSFGRHTVLVDSIRHLLALPSPADELLVVDQTPLHDADIEKALSNWNREGRIRWIRHHPPGTIGALNRGLAEAKGDIVLFLDDDIIPAKDLVVAHIRAHREHPEAWAVVGQVLNEPQKPQKTQKDIEKRSDRISLFLRILRLLRFPPPTHADSPLFHDLTFPFHSATPAWVINVMAGNLSVKRDRALALGGFDPLFVPPVSYRFETDFAKRIIAAGGKIWFEPTASILHLRAPSGGTRNSGHHMASMSPLHGVGDYYYAFKHGQGWDRIRYIARRPFREVCTKFHLRHPWWIPVKFVGELRAIRMASKIYSEAKVKKNEGKANI